MYTGGFELYFMKMPEYDYSLGKLANVEDMPGDGSSDPYPVLIIPGPKNNTPSNLLDSIFTSCRCFKESV